MAVREKDHTLQPEGLDQRKPECSKIRRPEGHNIKKSTRKKSLKKEMSTTATNKPEQPEGLDQQKLEGS